MASSFKEAFLKVGLIKEEDVTRQKIEEENRIHKEKEKEISRQQVESMIEQDNQHAHMKGRRRPL